MRKILTLILAALLWASCDYSTISSVSGKVVDKGDLSPVPSASVELVPGPSMLTGADGVFRFENVDPIDCYITVRKDGYKFERKGVSVVAGRNTEVIIELERINNE